MIYLFDEKRNRQRDYGWQVSRFDKYATQILPIYSPTKLDEEIKKQIFRRGNVVLFHESFFDSFLPQEKVDSTEIRNQLNQFAKENEEFEVIYFSGSKSSRVLSRNIGHIPVSILYQNLETFIKNTTEQGYDLRYLLFGENFEIEKVLLKRFDAALAEIDEIDLVPTPDLHNFIALSLKDEIYPVFDKEKNETFFLEEKYDLQITDEYLHDKVIEWFSETEYANLFIPLCFGPTLSDYNGLRFAFHIRCTVTPNQLKPIFIYSFVDPVYLYRHELFDILKTKGIYLIPYKKKAFRTAFNYKYTKLNAELLAQEIAKIHLDPPKDYEDSHSVANEWAIYKWATLIQALDSNIERVINRVEHRLYFKFLQTCFSSRVSNPLKQEDLKIMFSGTPKILYVDDEANKGWYEIFCTLLVDHNNIADFYYLDIEFHSLAQEEIISKALRKISDSQIDIVILDFRLHPNDFTTNKSQEITGYKLLKQIKAKNPGIQVIVFSATNKIWNFQSLQELGVDGFIIKESPFNSADKDFTSEIIRSFTNHLSETIDRIFLKQFFQDCYEIEKNLNHCDAVDKTEFDDFVKDLKNHIRIIIAAGKNINSRSSSTLDIVFVNCYNFLEKFKHQYLREVEYQLVLGIEEVEMNRYSPIKGQIKNEGRFIRNNKNDNPSWFNVMAGLFIDYFLLSNIHDSSIRNLLHVKDKRNAYIHGNYKRFSRGDLFKILSICKEITSALKE